ncbi:MAG: gluconokinase [Richelia sp. RM2_1_2]|nr:gluconokinase [Richelia sp. SM2_1_7]NJM18160.1 gluconokinase [Richelia sp. SM1_7_0]NJN11217.1 gluconokinase [Richelia sp. RM1_1_1]NJO27469.1 gluconokinase [Richelia sp. SL_2_1]NJO58567.1 gluconokinase [Richelia sp. RM2_1_2]
MGVSGSGKTTVGKKLAESLGWEFRDADDFHSQENVEKMLHGIALDDADRLPWLQKIQDVIKEYLSVNKNLVLSCSALKENYREMLLVNQNFVKLVYLKGSFELIQNRLQERLNHFMSEKLLKSQFDILEEPTDVIVVDISEPLEAIVEEIRKNL